MGGKLVAMVAFCALVAAVHCKKKTNEGIEETNRSKLEKLIAAEKLLAVFFYTKSCKDCGQILEKYTQILDDTRNFGVVFVKNSEKSTAKKYGVTSFPSLVYFRNEEPAIFDGDLKDHEKVKTYLTDLDRLKNPDKIEEVNSKILQNLIEDSDFLAVLLCKEDSEECEKVLQQLEHIDDDADRENIEMVKISDENLAIEYGLDTQNSLPALVYFRKKYPLLYDGDLHKENDVLKFLFEFKDDDEDEAIEDVSANNLASLIEETTYLAVLFYDLESRRSQRVLAEFENIDQEAAANGIVLVKIDNNKIAEEYGIENLPALVYFENKIPNFYQGDLTKEQDVLEWLIHQVKSDQIEDVTEKVLQQMIKNTPEMAALFYDINDEDSNPVLEQLEKIDDDVDQLGLQFVKIQDASLAEDYGISDLPQLIFFESQVPTFYAGNLTDSEEVLQWLKKRKTSDEIELISDDVLELMIDKSDYLAVIFVEDDQDAAAQSTLNLLENIDDESDHAGIPLVASESKKFSEMYGVENKPALVFFDNGVPLVYDGDLTNVEEVLKYLLDEKSSDDIEDVSPKILKQMVEKYEHLAVLFYDKDDKKSKEVTRDLESIDEENLVFVKIDNEELATEYGFQDDIPVLVYFEKKVPSVYQGDLTAEQQVLKWLHTQLVSDGIEEVTEKILFNLISNNKFVAVLFYDHKSKKSAKVLKGLETIDDDTDRYDILLIKINNFAAAQKYGMKKLPCLLFFREGSPIVYEGNLMNEEDVLQFLIDEIASDEIEDVNENTLDSLIENNDYVAVFFYDKDAAVSAKILQELENIDGLLKQHGIRFVRIDDDTVAKEYGILDELPILVYFENNLPSVYEGDLMIEEDALKWIIKNKEEDTIEEVTDEILSEMIKKHEYVLVFFAPNDCPECQKILQEFEQVDTFIDEHGIMFVTTDDTSVAKKEAHIKKFPAVVLFRNGLPTVYKGDLMDEDSLLKWVTSEEALSIPDRIEEVNSRMLDKLLVTSPYVAVLFYQEDDPECESILAELEKIDSHVEGSHDIDFVKIHADADISDEYSIVSFPTLVFFRKRFPQYYDGDLMHHEKVMKWLIDTKQIREDVIEFVDKKMLDVLLDNINHIVVYFYETGCTNCVKIIDELEKIDELTDKAGIHFVKTNDVESAEKLGVTEFPTLVYFEHQIPSIYSGDLQNSKTVLAWLINEKNEDTIENINRQMLFKLIEEQEFLAVLFFSEGDKDSDDVIHRLEKIDDDCSEFGIHLVKMSDKFMAKKYGIRNPPGLVFFRNGIAAKYNGKMKDEEEVLEYLINPETLAVSDVIEKFNPKMFERVLKKYDYVAVFFYSKSGCKLCSKVLEELERVDDECSEEGIQIIKIDDVDFAKKYKVFAFPAILFFRGPDSEPIIYTGDMKNGDRMLDWLLKQKDPTIDTIEEVNGNNLAELIQAEDYLAVFFYEQKMCSNCESGNVDLIECEDCQIIMDELENIDDDTSRNGIKLVKTTDLNMAKSYGIKITPALVYFENQVPSIYEGDLAADDEVLEWLLHEKSEATIETVNKAMLEKMIEHSQYLAVFFYKPHCHACQVALQELEKIDDDTDLYGIHVVRIYDLQVSKRYGIKTFPALVYFRNGNPLIFDGDIKNEESVLEYLIDDDNRELPNEIEMINFRMLNKLVEESPFLAVYFYDDDNCPECDRILLVLEGIDDKCDNLGIDLVKISDPEAFEKYNVTSVPALAFFRKQVALFYEGDLYNQEELLKYITSDDMFKLKDEIEEVNRKILDKLLDDNEFAAVFFYENNCPKCEEALHELEHIDDEADDLDILFVKIRDPRYAKKFGITQLPALVYFRKKFPSIYRGDLMDEEKVLEYLQKNRHRHPELNLFMYGLLAITLSFIIYTAVLMYYRHKNKEKKD